ncbi:MAG: hypothetical protein ACK5NL_09430 [Vibrio fluvialis]
MTYQQEAILKLEKSDFSENEKSFLLNAALSFLHPDLANEVLAKMMEAA